MTDPKPARKKRQTRALIIWNELGDATATGELAGAMAVILRGAGFAVSAFNLEDDIDRLLSAVVVAMPDIVVNLVQEFYGDTTQQGAVAGFLDLLGAPYAGSDAARLVSCQDRVRTHLVLDDAGVDVPPFEAVRDINGIPDTSHLGFPVIVTQAIDDTYEDDGQEHSLHNRTAIENRVYELAREYDLPLKIESYVEHRRVHAIVIGDRLLEVLPIVEWNYGATAEVTAAQTAGGESGAASNPNPETSAAAEADVNTAVRPEGHVIAQLAQGTLGRVRDLARRAFRAAGCRDYAQIDIHLDELDNAFVVDVRPTFDMSQGSTFHFACERTERGFDQTFVYIVTNACRRALAFEESELHVPQSDEPSPTDGDDDENGDADGDSAEAAAGAGTEAGTEAASAPPHSEPPKAAESGANGALTAPSVASKLVAVAIDTAR